MVRKSESDHGIAYPQLAREDINLIIDNMVWVIRQRDLGRDIDRAESIAAYLTQFYTKRWGMPPCITGRIERIRELASDWPAHGQGGGTDVV